MRTQLAVSVLNAQLRKAVKLPKGRSIVSVCGGFFFPCSIELSLDGLKTWHDRFTNVVDTWKGML